MNMKVTGYVIKCNFIYITQTQSLTNLTLNWMNAFDIISNQTLISVCLENVQYWLYIFPNNMSHSCMNYVYTPGMDDKHYW